jgi:hypothetical protein
MEKSIFSKYLIPFIQWYALMILIAIIIDYFLHRWHFVQVGVFCGYAGTGIIILSFVYSLRKRKIIHTGTPKQLLHIHEYMAWGGSILILVHAGIHFNAVLPWLAILMMLIAVASGLVGKFLLKNASETLKHKKEELIKGGMTKEEAERKLFFDGITVDMMRKWRVVHLPITLLLGILVLMHIITIVMFSK